MKKEGIIKINIFLSGVFILILTGCDSNDYHDVRIDLDYYIVNQRSDEILLRNRRDAEGVIGFFLKPTETYHIGYHNDITIDKTKERPDTFDLRGLYMSFDFYVAGANNDFQQNVGSYDFAPKLNYSNAYIDTCFVY